MLDSIPTLIKIYAGLVGMIGLLFAFAGYFNPTQMAPDATLNTVGNRLAFYTIGSTVSALSIGLFLAILSNRPKSMALMLIVRVVAAIQDFIIAIVLSLGAGLVAFQAVISLLGIASIVKLFQIIRTPDQKG